MNLLGIVIILITLLSSCNSSSTLPPVPGDIDQNATDLIYINVQTSQTHYIHSLQKASGAIKDTEASNSKICPYFANFACKALLKNPTIENITVVKKYMQWYMSKLNGTLNPISGKPEIAGSVYDYYGETETTRGEYDSVDSYAATFLTLAMEFASTSETNKTWLSQFDDKLNLIASALEKCLDTESNTMHGILSTDNNNYLSVASHEYDVKYLMDNCEVNEGLKAAQWLKKNELITISNFDFDYLANKNSASIETALWRETTNAYNPYDNGSNNSITNWDVFYPDATSQLYPMLFGILDPTSVRAKTLYTQFNNNYPAWSSGQVYSGTYPWAILVYAAAIINDKTRVEEYIKHINTYNIKNAQKDYWYSLEAAFTLMAIHKIKNNGNTSVYSPIL